MTLTLEQAIERATMLREGYFPGQAAHDELTSILAAMQQAQATIAEQAEQVRRLILDNASWESTCDLQADSMTTQAAEIEQMTAELKKATTPSWFWNDEDPETPYTSPDEWLESEDWGIAHGHKIRFMTAKKLPDQYFRVVNVSEDDQELVEITKEEYKASEAALAQASKKEVE